MQIHLGKITLLVGLLIASLAEARVGLKQAPISLGGYDPSSSELATLSPNGSLFGAIDENGDARVWNLSFKEQPQLEMRSDSQHGKSYVDLVFSTNNKYIIFDSTNINTSLANKGQITVVAIEAYFAQEEFDTYIYGGSGESKFALSNLDLLAYVPAHDFRVIRFVNLKTNTRHQISTGAGCPITALAFDPSGAKIAVKDMCAASIQIFEISSGKLLDLVLDSPMPDDIFSPEKTLFFWGQGNMLAVNSDQEGFAFACDANTGKGQFPFFWEASLAMFQSNNSNMLAIADTFFNLNIQKLNDPTNYVLLPFVIAPVTSGAFAPNDKIFALGSAAGQIALYDSGLNFLGAGSLAQASEVQQLSFVNNKQFISLSDDNNLTLWEIN